MEYRIVREERGYYAVKDRSGTVLRTADSMREAEEEAEDLRRHTPAREAIDDR